MSEGIKQFDQTLREACDGEINADCALEFFALLEALKDEWCRNQGTVPKGVFTLKIGVKYDGKSLSLAHEVAIKKPKRVRAAGVAYIAKDGNLTVRNPKQLDLRLTGDPAAPVVARDVTEAPRVAQETGEKPRMAVVQ